MNNLQTLVLLMALAIVLVGVALRLRIPYPITLVLGGAAIGFIPGLHKIYFNPNLVLIIVLPPILYDAAYSIPFKEFQRNIQDILWLALGLVVVTTLVIGLLFKWLFPDLPWAIAFAFGAIVSPPDAVAATAILKRFSISSRLLAILEGECLINDATGLVLYKLALVALFSGTFSFEEASVEFIKVAIGGLSIGLITGYLLHAFSSRFFDPILAVVYSFAIPYMTYILADALGYSGVLAVVVNGLIGSRMLVTHFSSLTRVVGWASWDVLTILLNCFIFLLIGLQVHDVIQRLMIEKTLLYFAYGVLLTAAAILIRFLWIYTRKGFTYFKTKKDLQSRQLYLRDSIILSWSGMRGIVSVTAALALPFTLPDGNPLPGRDVVIFLTFVIILLTLLIPGLTLPSLMRRLNIQSSYEDLDTKTARNELVKAAREEIRLLHTTRHIDDQENSFLLTYFSTRHQILEIASKIKMMPHALESARLKILHRQRQRLLEMWKKHEIDDHLFNLLEHELDLEEAYLGRAKI